MLNARGYLKKEPFPLPPKRPEILHTALRLHVEEHGYTRSELGVLAFLSERDFAKVFSMAEDADRRLRAVT